MTTIAKQLERLVCPVCHGRLFAEGEAAVCAGCGRRYPAVDGLLVLLAGRATRS